MAQKDIYKLVNELAKKVEFLEEKLIKQQRENADLMEQMSKQASSGVSSSFVGQVNKKFSEIMQTEEKIQSTVADFSDDTTKKFSQVTQTAEGIKTTVANLEKDVKGNKEDISEVEQTALSISTTVTKIYGATEAVTSESEMKDKSVMYRCGGFYYYFNEITGDWEKVNTNSVVSQLIQTKDGFVLNGDVKISGDQIVEGTITGTEIELGKNNFYDTIRLETVGGVPRLAFYHSGGLLGYISSQDAGRVLFQSGESSEIGFGGKVDFSVATVTGLYAVFE